MLCYGSYNISDLESFIFGDTGKVWNKCLFLPPLGKGKRLKQAKEEATAEIDHYRLQREKEFRNKETNVSKKPACVLLSYQMLNGKPNCFQEYYLETSANQCGHTDETQGYHLQCLHASFGLFSQALNAFVEEIEDIHH